MLVLLILLRSENLSISIAAASPHQGNLHELSEQPCGNPGLNIPPLKGSPADHETGQSNAYEPDGLFSELIPGNVPFEQEQPGFHSGSGEKLTERVEGGKRDRRKDAISNTNSDSQTY